MRAEGLKREAAELKSDIIAVRRHLHAHAETGFDLRDTLPYVRYKLEKMGYEPKPCCMAGCIGPNLCEKVNRR